MTPKLTPHSLQQTYLYTHFWFALRCHPAAEVSENSKGYLSVHYFCPDAVITTHWMLLHEIFEVTCRSSYDGVFSGATLGLTAVTQHHPLCQSGFTNNPVSVFQRHWWQEKWENDWTPSVAPLMFYQTKPPPYHHMEHHGVILQINRFLSNLPSLL